MGLITLQVSIQTVLDKFFFFVTFGSHGTQFERLRLEIMQCARNLQISQSIARRSD